MNPLFMVTGILMLVVGVFFVKELMKKPQRPAPPFPAQAPLQPPQQFFPQGQQFQQQPQKKDYRQAYSELQQEMKIKKEENQLSSQSRTHLGNPREAFKTVDTDYEQAKMKMWGINELKNPTNPEDYNQEQDATMYWNRKQSSVYFLLAVISFILFLMLGV